MGMSVEGWASVAAGEDWHYVDGAGEPALNADFAAAGTPWPAPAFRLREAGIVDLAGTVTGVTGGGIELFTLPAGYRPNEQAFVVGLMEIPATSWTPILVVVNDNGDVTFGGPTPATGDVVYFAGSIFLDTAAP